MTGEDPLARVHREYREECMKAGTYKGIDPRAVEREVARWRAECERKPNPPGKRRKPPKGHAD